MEKLLKELKKHAKKDGKVIKEEARKSMENQMADYGASSLFNFE